MNSRFGVVEGYYGRTWTREDRDACLAVFPSLELHHYLYAPKSDAYLRKNWRSVYLESEFQVLAGTLSHASKMGLQVGLGFSPFGLHDLSSSREREFLKARMREFSDLPLDWFGVFFDDMECSGSSLASSQIAIVEFIAEQLNGVRLIVCPSYYTRDPILESLFGARPKNYWKELGKNLDEKIDFFWTGEQVCSREFDRFDLEKIADEMRRLPSLWDNYPVNDGERMSQFLHLEPFSERPTWLENYSRWHFANPMNQPFTSLLPLSTLSLAHSEAGDDLKHMQAKRWNDIAEKYAADVAQQLGEDRDDFSTRGLIEMSDDFKANAISYYGDKRSPIAVEISEWLRGEYKFDPECLTG